MSEPNQNGVLPVVIEANRLAKQQRMLKGDICIGDLQRLPELAQEIQQPLTVELQFFVDEQGRKRVNGTINASLTLVCQRCLGDLVFQVEPGVDLVILKTDAQAQSLPTDTEWLVVDENNCLDLVALVEDEIILALPSIASHAEGLCHPPEAGHDNQPEVLTSDAVKKSSPFDVLGQLKTKH